MTKNFKDFKNPERYADHERNACLAVEQVVENVKNGNGDYSDWAVSDLSDEPFDLREASMKMQPVTFEMLGPVTFGRKIMDSIKRMDPKLDTVEPGVKPGSSLERRCKEIDPNVDMERIKVLTLTGPDVSVSMWANALLSMLSAAAVYVKQDLGREPHEAGGIDPRAVLGAIPIVISQLVSQYDDESRKAAIAGMLSDLAEVAMTGGLQSEKLIDDDFNVVDKLDANTQTEGSA